MGYSGVQILSFALVLTGTIAVGASIYFSHWSVYESSTLSYWRGLWQSCKEVASMEYCTNRYEKLIDPDAMKAAIEDGTAPTDLKLWEVIVLILMASSAFFGVVAIALAPCCCHRCGCCVSGSALFAGLLALGGVGLFVYFQESGKSVTIDLGILGNFSLDTDAIAPSYGWTFFVAAAGTVLQLIAGVMFCVGKGRNEGYMQAI